MVDRHERIKALQEVVRRLESVGAGPTGGEQDFDDARVDAYIATALTAARSALAIAKERDDT